MFDVRESRLGRGYQGTVLGLILLSLAAVGIGAWSLWDFRRDQRIVAELMPLVPPEARAETRELADDLRLQSRLLVLVLLNVVVTGVALVLLLRTLRSSQRSLRHMTGLANDILESMDQGVLTIDRWGTISSINRRGLELLGLSAQGPPWSLATLEAQHAPLAEMNRQVLQTQQVIREQDYHVVIGGHPRSLRGGCSLLVDADGQQLGTVIHLRDVTERLLLEQRMRRMEAHLGLGSLATGLQHEIKNPLSALSLHVQLLAETLAEHNTTPEIDETIEVLNIEVRRITQVLENFRDYASDGGLQRSPTEIADLLRSMRRLLALQADRQKVQVQLELPAEPLPPMEVDATKLQQVVLNLCLNALQAMPRGGVLGLRARATEAFLEIDVADTGAGIPEELRERIFEPYFTTRGEGTGMGLALSDKVVRQHGGAITYRCDSAGTVFIVSLPREPLRCPNSFGC